MPLAGSGAGGDASSRAVRCLRTVAFAEQELSHLLFLTATLSPFLSFVVTPQRLISPLSPSLHLSMLLPALSTSAGPSHGRPPASTNRAAAGCCRPSPRPPASPRQRCPRVPASVYAQPGPPALPQEAAPLLLADGDCTQFPCSPQVKEASGGGKGGGGVHAFGVDVCRV